jgi:hypothetical protein
MRDIRTVINEIRTHVPANERPLLYDLEDIYSSASYRAPEIWYVDWETLQHVLLNRIGEVPSEEWQFEVLSIFSTLSVGDIKQEVLANK